MVAVLSDPSVTCPTQIKPDREIQIIIDPPGAVGSDGLALRRIFVQLPGF